MTVVTDTSVVLNLAWLEQDGLLHLLYETVLASTTVRDEFERLAKSDHRFRGLSFPNFVIVVDPLVILPALARKPSLDAGEIAALSLAVERGAKDVLIDERVGRTAAATLVCALPACSVSWWNPNHVAGFRLSSRFWTACRWALDSGSARSYAIAFFD